VVIGLLETHGRTDIAKLAKDWKLAQGNGRISRVIVEDEWTWMRLSP